MPLFEICSLTCDNVRQETFARLLATIWWPQDDELCRTFIARVMAGRWQEFTAALEVAEAAESFDRVQTLHMARRHFEKSFFAPYGGMPAVLAAVGFESPTARVRAKQKAVTAAMHIANTALHVRAHNQLCQPELKITLNRLLHFVAETAKEQLERPSRSCLIEAWMPFRGVAHLLVANDFIARRVPSGLSAQQQVKAYIQLLPLLLPLAQSVQEVLERIRLPGDVQLVPSAELWRVRFTCPDDWPRIAPSFPAMTDAEIRTYRSYSAPK